MFKEPGTIYSDDDIDILSEDDNDENDNFPEREEENKKVLKKGDKKKRKIDKVDNTDHEILTDDFFSEENFLDAKISKPEARPVKKKLKIEVPRAPTSKNEATALAILNIRIKNGLDNDLEVIADSQEEPIIDCDNVAVKERVKNPDEKKIIMKEKKKVRKTLEHEEQLANDKIEYNFEDAAFPTEEVTFLQMNLSAPLLKAVREMGFEAPTPIQAATIPVALKGRDICGCASTGTGKTAAFMLPILQRLTVRRKKNNVTRVLVLVPTRELGHQVHGVTKQLCKYTDVEVVLSVGGVDYEEQQTNFLANPDIIVATPGRLIDHIYNTKNFSLKEIEVLVLDEADRMLDEHFTDQIKEIIDQSCITRQTMLFSATMTDQVKDLVAASLKNPVRVFVNSNTDVAQNLSQEFIKLRPTHKYRKGVLAHLLLHTFKDKQLLVFVPTKIECHELRVRMGLLGVNAGELHSNLTQEQRFESLEQFRDKSLKVLFATDIAARGLDIKGVEVVINYHVPQTYQIYVHRVGRTARAGYSGRSVTLSHSNGDDFKMLKSIKKQSLIPLYERVIDPKNAEMMLEKLVAVESAAKEVMEIEKDQKLLRKLQMEVHTMKLLESNNKPDKTIPKKWYQNPESVFKHLSERKKHYQELNSGKITKRKTKRVKQPKVFGPKLSKKKGKSLKNINSIGQISEKKDKAPKNKVSLKNQSRFEREHVWTGMDKKNQRKKPKEKKMGE